jgi:hypothetical protein
MAPQIPSMPMLNKFKLVKLPIDGGITPDIFSS